MRYGLLAGASALAAVAGCSVDAVQLEGRACPCETGWVCDSTQHCVLPDGSADDAAPPGDAASDAGDAGNLLFDEEFDGGVIDTNKWVVAGDGTWSIANAVGVQSDPAAQETLMYAKSFTSATDYHVVARMHATGPFAPNQDVAPEVCFRTDPSVITSGIPQTYHCNMDFFYKQLIIQSTSTTSGTLAQTDFTLPPNFDKSTWFVLDLTVTGTDVTCTVTVDGLGQLATVSANNAVRAAGSFGLKTYDTSAEFAYFRVYSAP